MATKKKNPAAVALGRLGGQSKSEKKINAVRANGAKGGRPRKGNMKYVLMRKRDGWFVGLGGGHESNPSRAISFTHPKELKEWLSVWGIAYEAIELRLAEEVR